MSTPIQKYLCLECGAEWEQHGGLAWCPNDAGMMSYDCHKEQVPLFAALGRGRLVPTHHRIRWLNFESAAREPVEGKDHVDGG